MQRPCCRARLHQKGRSTRVGKPSSRLASSSKAIQNRVWSFALPWGSSEDVYLRAAIATCVLEDLLQHHLIVLSLGSKKRRTATSASQELPSRAGSSANRRSRNGRLASIG